MTEIAISTIVGSASFLAGGVFGAATRASDFCTMGALSDIVFLSDWRRMRAWVLAMAVAMLGSQALQASGLIDLGKSIYLSGAVAWAGALIGGLMFGFGMTMTGGCGSKTLVRIGGGNLKSLVVMLVIGLFATMTLKGLLALPRIGLEQASNIAVGGGNQSLPSLLTRLGVHAAVAKVLPVALAGAMLAWSLRSDAFRASRLVVGASVVIGLAIPAGWAITGILGNDDFEPTALASFSFIAPMGDGLIYLMTFTGSTINFGIAAIGGVMAGAFVAAKAQGNFAVEGFTDRSDMLRHLAGAALMGTGGVMAMGCTIGQGLTGLSTLSLTSIIAIAAIITGGIWGLKSLEEGSVTGGLRALLRRA